MDFEPSFPPINLSRSRLSAQPEPSMTKDQIHQELNQLHTLEQNIQEAIQNAQHVQESLIPPTSITTLQMPPPFYPTTTSTQIPPFRTTFPPSSTFASLDQSLWIEDHPRPQVHTCPHCQRTKTIVKNFQDEMSCYCIDFPAKAWSVLTFLVQNPVFSFVPLKGCKRHCEASPPVKGALVTSGFELSSRWKDCWSDCGWEAVAWISIWVLKGGIVRHLVVWRLSGGGWIVGRIRRRARNEEDSDTASVDHLSDGEEEVFEIRTQKIAPKPRQKPSKMFDATFLTRIYSALDREEYVDTEVRPLAEDHDHVGDQFPIHDPSIKWKLMKPVLGERYESPDQLKRALAFYALANGYKLYYDVIPHRKTYMINRGKKKALNQYQTCLEDYYGMLWSYASEILNSNPGSTCKLGVDNMPNGKNYFKTFCVCFKGVKQGWLQGCRRVIGFTIISDQHKGLIEADDEGSNEGCILYKKEGFHVIFWEVQFLTESRFIIDHFILWIVDGFLQSLRFRGSNVSSIASSFPFFNEGSSSKITSTLDQWRAVCALGLSKSAVSCRIASKVMAGVSDVDILLGGILFTIHSQDLTSITFLKLDMFIFQISEWGSEYNTERRLVVPNLQFEGKGVKEHLGSVHERVEGLVGDVLKRMLECSSLAHKSDGEEIRMKMEVDENSWVVIARHIYANFKKKFNGVVYRNLFWKVAKATYPAKFERIMYEMKSVSMDAHKHLMKRKPKSWSRAFFSTDKACDAVENGISECFNALIVEARRKPIRIKNVVSI
ncbi:hypothetical protein Tco_1459542 [Tanacetum coccineum]